MERRNHISWTSFGVLRMAHTYSFWTLTTAKNTNGLKTLYKLKASACCLTYMASATTAAQTGYWTRKKKEPQVEDIVGNTDWRLVPILR